MKRLHSSELQGANAYFTNFDNRIVASSSNFMDLYSDVTRTLKILLLTKNNVVCAASHLINPLTFQLLSDNPIILEKEMIIPAFRADKNNISELFERKKISTKRKQTIVAFYEEHLSKTVLWDLQQNSTWFRDTFIQGLLSKNSVIRKNLSNLSNKEINTLISKTQDRIFLDRETIEELSQSFDAHSKIVLRNYRELVYHMSGARVVNCESTLPQENYIDYSFTDLSNNKTRLSETQVFWKIYIELLLEMLHRYKFPVEALDYLSFEDIYYLRQPILESSFIENYNKLYHIATNSIVANLEKRNDIIYNSTELLKIKNSLEEQYTFIFEKELPSYFKKRAISEGLDLLKNTANIGLGFLPLNNVLTGIITAPENMRSVYFNIMQLFHNSKSINDYDHYIRLKTDLLHKEIMDFDIEKGTEMIDIVELIQKTLSNKSQF